MNRQFLTHKERSKYVEAKFFKCIKDISSCKAGQYYWFEYHSGNEPYYMKLSDNTHYDKVYLTDDELLNCFIFDHCC